MATKSTLRAFLFTDLVGSMDLKRRLGDGGYASILAGHDRLYRECQARFDGHEVDHAGDGFFTVFDVPSNALLCALAFQHGMAGLDERLSARAGVHIGEVVQAEGTEGKFTGLAVDLAARVMGLAGGGQVLLTRHAFDSVRQQVIEAPDGSEVSWRSHGSYLVKGFDDPVEIFEAGVEGRAPFLAPADSEKVKRVGVLGAIEGIRILEEIGAGGMGTVYLASVERERSGLKQGQRVALKVMHPHLLAEKTVIERFHREAQVGMEVSHENVVPVHFVGETEQDGKTVPFLVMDFVRGSSLWDLLNELETIPDGLLREIGRQSAAGLAALHSAGAVHRDLKPRNILITEEYRVQLIDLGMVRPLDPSVDLTTEGSFLGTPLYAAPEQFGRADVGPAADLYSLGVILFELGTGQHPFPRETMPSLIKAHLLEDPATPRDLQPELSPLMNEVILTLMSKAPADRFASAAEVDAVLTEGEASPWWSEREARVMVAVAARPEIPVGRVTAVHGREADLDLLRDAWMRARLARGHAVLLEGEAGIGKTRLADAFVESVAGEGVEILYGRFLPGGAGSGPAQALLGRFGTAGLESFLARHLEDTPALVAPFAALLRHEPPPEGSDPIRSEAVHAVYCSLLRSLSEDRPLLWIVEDLHFADPESRGLVLSLARAAEGRPVLLLLTSEPGVSEEEIAHFGRLAGFYRSPLDRLSRRASLALLRERFGNEALAEKLAPRIAERCDGVPYFLLETVRGLVEANHLAEDEDGALLELRPVEEITVPRAVRDLILSRLGGLTDEDRSLLEVGAVMGFEFDAGLVAVVQEMKRIRLLERLAVLERRTGLVRTGVGRHLFDHHQVRQVLYEGLSDMLRGEYHAALAEACTERCGEPDQAPGDDACFVARHHLLGSRPRAGIPYLDGALTHLEATHQNEAAIDLCRRALEPAQLLPDAARLNVLLRLADRLDVLGRREPQRLVLEEAAALSKSLGDPALRSRARRALGWYRYSIADLTGAREALEEAAELARAAGDRGAEADATGVLGNVLTFLGRFEEATSELERQRDIAREIGDRRGEESATAGLGNVYLSLGRFADAATAYESWLGFARETGDKGEEATATGNLGILDRRMGRKEEARDRFRRWLDLAHEIGDRRSEGAATGNLGMMLRDLGRFTEARTHLENWLAIAREIGDRRSEQAAEGILGSVLRLSGRFELARQRFEAHLNLAKEIGDRLAESIARVNLGSLLAECGDRSQAVEIVAEAVTTFRELGTRREEGYALQVEGEIAEQAGDRDRAVERFREAAELLGETGDASGRAVSLLALGRTLAARGEDEEGEAPAVLEEAARIGREADLADVVVLAAAHLALPPTRRLGAAMKVWGELGDRLGLPERMRAHALLWRATGKPDHLDAARKALAEIAEHAPPALREALIEDVPLHREIREAGEQPG